MRTSRRQFLAIGAAGGAALALAACGSDAAKATPAYDLLIRLTDAPLLVPGESRVALSLAAEQTMVMSGPATLTAKLLDSGGATVAEMTADQHNDGIPQAYWPFRFTIDTPGFYRLSIDGGNPQSGNFGVFETSQVTMPYIGSTLPQFDTPTVGDHRGVEPYCSLTPAPCPLHDVTLTEALQSGKPLVFMVGTPAHCQTGACAPALEFLVANHQRVGDAAMMVHADVYADNAATEQAPIIDALGLDYEPVVYFATPGGQIVDRLDGIWDQTELDQRVDALLAR
jgi:TAT (twin-arginine translocation) pathway signal sequence